MNTESKSEWHSGPPPSIGWWPASIFKLETILRWWNGKHWSDPVGIHNNQFRAGHIARFPAAFSNNIVWKQRPKDWPPQSYT